MNAPLLSQDHMHWLLDRVYEPFALAKCANQKRTEAFGNNIALRSWSQDDAAPYTLAWDQASPASDILASSVAFSVDCDTPEARRLFLGWLSQQLAHGPAWTELCAWSTSDSSTYRSWLTAALRILAPPKMRVALRVDQLGLRTSQICLNFGADTLAAPLTASRKLPIAGVASPHESSRIGLATLVEQAGLSPDFSQRSETSSP